MTNWQTKKLGDAMEFIPTGSHSRNDMTIATGDEEEVLNIHYGDIHTKYSTYVDCEEDSVPALKDNNIRVQMLLKDGDLVVADASEDYDGVGSSVELRNVSDRKVIGGLHTFALRSKDEEFASGFTGLMLKNPATRKRLMQMSVYSKVYGLTKSSISSVDVSYPEKPEQERIVGVLEVWDEYIEKLEQKIALKEQLKKGLMQQLLTGKAKFADMQQDWKEYKIGDLLEVLTDYTANGSFASLKDNVKYFSSSEHAALVRTTDLEKKVFKPVRFTDKRGYDYLKKTSLYGGELIMSNVGNIGKVYRVPNYDGLMTLAPNTYLIKFIDTIVDSDYIYQLMRTSGFRSRVLKMVGGGEGGGLVAINKANFRSIKVTIPELGVQKKIANILEMADRDIESLDRLKYFALNQKKYLLKNLITGTIRTPEDLHPLDASRLERSAL